jgi:predicted GIY-YIG superfamily endonuclease
VGFTSAERASDGKPREGPTQRTCGASKSENELRMVSRIRFIPLSSDCKYFDSPRSSSKSARTSESLGSASNLHESADMGLPRCIVYVLKSETAPGRYYTGLTSNLAARVDAHNAGRCPHTASGKPWIVDVIIEFSDERRAVGLERYLKSGSGVAFATRHFR